MKLYFLRHGIAADREEWQGDDASRPLTADGRKCMEREAKALMKLELEPEVVITSPLRRAKETAEIVAERLGIQNRVIEDERLAESFDVERLAQLLQDHERAQTILLVGHEPDFSHTIGELTGGAKIDLKKGGLARVDVPDGSTLAGELVWLIPPKVLVQ